MPIRRGCPIDSSEINDLVATHYPDHDAAFPSLPASSPLRVNQFPPPSVDGDYAKRILVAMICPPNTAPRASTLFGLPLTTPGGIGVGTSFLRGHPIEAPDVFEDFTSALYAGVTGGIVDVGVQLSAWIASHPNVRVLGTMFSDYSNGLNNAATAKVAGKQLVP